MHKSGLIIVAAALSLVVGALGGAWLAQRAAVKTTPAPDTMPPSMPMAAPASAAQEIIVSIPPDAVERMHLGFAQVTESAATAEVRVPGTVQPNAYREVRVTSLVGGVATRISAELGQAVKQGEALAQIFSRELAAAQTEFVGFQAQLEAEHKRLVRAQDLVRLGAASR